MMEKPRITESWPIEAYGLRKEFGSKVAVADLTLQVSRGEIFGFLGPNGAGKTTSIKMLLGLTAPTDGTAVLLGKPIGDPDSRRRVGFLPEHFRFHEWLRADEFLDLHGRLYGMSRRVRREIIPDLLTLVGLADRADTRLRAFSKGMLQRIGLAQALLNNPELVFLDEPTSGLDPLGRRLVRDIITTLRQAGTTVFLNSHLLSEVEQTCDRVAFVRDGRIVQILDLHTSPTAPLQVIVRVGQPSAELLTHLQQFGCQARLDATNGRITLDAVPEARLPELAHWLIQNNYTLYELTPRLPSLEEQFMQSVGYAPLE